MNKIYEKIIEITWEFDRLEQEGKLSSSFREDFPSEEIKDTICAWAEEFEKERFKSVDHDYLTVIQEFAEEKIMGVYGKQDDQDNVLTFRDFLEDHRGANIRAMTRGGFMNLSAEQTQNYEELAHVSSCLGSCEDNFKRVFDEELLTATVMIRGYEKDKNQYSLLLDEVEGARIMERSQNEKNLAKRQAYMAQQMER